MYKQVKRHMNMNPAHEQHSLQIGNNTNELEFASKIEKYRILYSLSYEYK